MRPEPVLSADSLAVRYGDTTAVAGVSFDALGGEVRGIIGPDGAGKTSTLRVLAGLMRADGGEARAFGMPIWQHRRELHHRLGYLAQGFALYGDLTVDENIQFFAQLYGVKSWRARRARLLERVALDRFRDRGADALSGGMKQKLALVCTLIHEPEVLLLDEPTTGVDPVTRRELWRFLGDQVADGLTLVVTTPYIDEAERCSRVVLMHRGRVVADERPDAIPDRVPGTLVEVLCEDRAGAQAALGGIGGLVDLTPFGSAFHARFEGNGNAAERVRLTLEGAGIAPAEVRVVKASLEDAMLYLTGGEEEGS
jgi:ABC-2 type transport system ATP-binding protein